MTTNGTNGTAAKERALRSKRLYWVVGTIAVAAVLFTLYYSVYVSSQQAYYNERAFRLLSSMADKFALHVDIAENVLRASASYKDAEEAGDYIHRVLHGKMEEHDFTIVGWNKVDPTAKPTRQGTLTLFLPDSPNSFRIQADYREGARGLTPKAGKENEILPAPERPCSGKLPPLAVCATIDFDPLVRPSFRDLEEGFFDDVLIADSEGNVLYQESPEGIRIRNIGAALLSSIGAGSTSLFSKTTTTQSPSSSEANASRSFSALSQSSGRRTVELAGSDYELFVQPLPVSFKQQGRRLVLCGLRTVKHSHSQTLAVPYTYLMWSILVLLTVFALGWPLLKFLYMSPKERLQSRQILYLLTSILLATALVTLIALNASYKLTSDEVSKDELKQLADQINTNFTKELGSALGTLDVLAAEPSLLRLAVDGEGNRANFLQDHQDLFREHHLSYPYFRYFFVAGNDGWQRLKFTVNPETTPWTNVSEEPFFHPVKDGNFSEFKLGDTVRKMRMDPLFSPNTGEFLVVLAAPWTGAAPPQLRKTDPRLKVLAIKVESLFKPVLPTGYGYAVVAADGKVLFHSSSVRNMNEDFTKEAQENVSLVALLAQGSTGYLDVRYMGTDKKMWVTPLEATSGPRLTLIVFKDSSYSTTVNMTVVVVFAVLVVIYAILPFFLVVLVHVLRRQQYPLEVIWPNCERMSHYLHISIANVLLSAAFFHRYVSYGPVRALITVFAVALVAALYPFLECRGRLRVVANLLVLAVLVAVSDFSWVLVFAAAFAIYAFYPRSSALDRLLLNWLSLKYTYTLAAVSTLVILVIVPGSGFFKVSYDYVHQLFVQSQQLDLAERLEERRQAIETYYAHLNAPPVFKTMRLDEQLDRYDQLFLNCPVTDLDRSRAYNLRSTFVERGIRDLTSYFPVNPLAARLQELARTKKDLPGIKWQASDEMVKCPTNVLARGSLWLMGPGKPIVSPYPIWPALDWRVRLWLGAAIAGLAVWIHFVPQRLFLLDMETLPPLDKWQPQEDGKSQYLTHHILLLGHPKSGKRLTVQQLGYAQLLDFAEMATTGKWQVPTPCADVVALNHFEFGVDNADVNMNKLRILEELIHVQHKRIILLSTVDPLYYLTAGCPEVVVSGEKKDIATAIQLLDRWAVILTPFRKVMIEDITVPGFHRVAEEMGRRRQEPDFQAFVNRVIEECDHTAQLRKIGATILRAHRKDNGLPREQLVQELLDRADSYYRVLWSTCTRDERLVLYQLAKDGWANPKNELAIQHLQRRKLVVLPVPEIDRQFRRGDEPGIFASQVPKRLTGLRMMNESFRQFIRNSQHREEIAAWEQEGEQSVWRFMKLSLGILTVAVAAWLLYSQQQFFNAVVGYVGAVGAAAGVLFKLLSDLRGRSSAANAGAR